MSGTQQSSAPEEFSRRPGAERAARYRELADMHLRYGEQAHDPAARASHLELAALWTRLAAQAEHQPDDPDLSV